MLRRKRHSNELSSIAKIISPLYKAIFPSRKIVPTDSGAAIIGFFVIEVEY